MLPTEASHDAFLNCYWPMADGLLKELAHSVEQQGSQFVIMRTPQSLTCNLPILQSVCATLRQTSMPNLLILTANFAETDSTINANNIF